MFGPRKIAGNLFRETSLSLGVGSIGFPKGCRPNPAVPGKSSALPMEAGLGVQHGKIKADLRAYAGSADRRQLEHYPGQIAAIITKGVMANIT
jgi:hypothetical protein